MRFIAFFTVLLALGSKIGVPARAQDMPPPPSPRPETSKLLRDFWEREQRNRVLIVLPADELRQKQPQDQPTPRNLTEWLTANDATIRSIGGISAITNRSKITTAKKFGDPDFLNTGNPSVDRSNAAPLLMATLSAAQWREVASAQGLGFNGLSAEQKALWERMVPNPFAYTRLVLSNSGRVLFDKRERTLTSQERYQVHLRVKLVGSATASFNAYPGEFPVVFRKEMYEQALKGLPFLELNNGGRSDTSPTTAEEPGSNLYGQTTINRELARPEPLPAALETALSNGIVSLPEPDNKPVTVGDLLAALEPVSPVKLYADESFRKSSVIVIHRGTVRALDLLRALLFVKEHTIRILLPTKAGEQPLYVIAPTIEPRGRVDGRWSDWYAEAIEMSQQIASDASTRIRERNPVPLLQFDANDPLALSTALKGRVVTAARTDLTRTSGAWSGEVHVPLSELSPTAQELINEAAKRLAQNRDNGNDLSVNVEKVGVTCNPWLGFVVPGSGEMAGEIDALPLAELEQWVAPIPADAAPVKDRVLLVSADTVEEAQEWAAVAAQSGAKEVWLQAPPSVVAAAVPTAGKTPVRAVVSLLRTTRDTPETLPREVNLYGNKSRDWLMPDDPAVIRYAATNIRAAAAIPGVAGVVLRGAVPAGYRRTEEDSKEQRVTIGDTSEEYDGNARMLGYSLAHRRAYTQETGQDPADIYDDGSEVALEKWQAWRSALMLPLWKAVREAVGTTSVMVEGKATFGVPRHTYAAGIATFVPWDTKESEPPFIALFRNTEHIFPLVTEKPVTYSVTVGNPAAQLITEELVERLQRKLKPETTIWDLTDKSAPGVAERTRALRRYGEKP